MRRETRRMALLELKKLDDDDDDETLPIETRLRKVREERRGRLDEIRMARENANSFADEATVGVVVTHKNRAELCEETVRTLLKQTHRKLEIVIVDDGSEVEHLTRLERFVASVSSSAKWTLKFFPLYSLDSFGTVIPPLVCVFCIQFDC